MSAAATVAVEHPPRHQRPSSTLGTPPMVTFVIDQNAGECRRLQRERSVMCSTRLFDLVLPKPAPDRSRSKGGPARPSVLWLAVAESP